MNAVVIREHGGYDRLVLEQRAVPEPGPREVRVAIEAAGVNHLDTWVRRGVPGHTFPLPLVPGSDGAGVVDALGPGARGVAVGDEVVVLPGESCGVCAPCLQGRDELCARYAILGEARDGTCQEFVVVPDANLAPKPAGLDFPAAASVCLVFQTAWSMLHKARVGPGDAVLVHAGGSGVGSAAIQIAKLLGATVLTTAGSAEKCDRARALGADHAIDYTATDFAAEVRGLTAGRGVDVVFEHVGAATFDRSLRCLARGGRLVTCGATTGAAVELHLPRLFFKNLSVIGSTMGSKGDLRRVLDLVDRGALRPVLAEVLPLAEVARAHRMLEERAVFGRIALVP